MMTLDLEEIRQKLEAERDQLQKLIAAGAGKDSVRHRNPDRSDMAYDYATHERQVALLAVEQEQLAQVEAAIARLDAGTYGECANCKRQITPARLQALPYATLCIDCQTRHEHQW